MWCPQGSKSGSQKLVSRCNQVIYTAVCTSPLLLELCARKHCPFWTLARTCTHTHTHACMRVRTHTHTQTDRQTHTHNVYRRTPHPPTLNHIYHPSHPLPHTHSGSNLHASLFDFADAGDRITGGFIMKSVHVGSSIWHLFYPLHSTQYMELLSINIQQYFILIMIEQHWQTAGQQQQTL